jgi:NAD(P)-dependent dehydrogenase (short-subunit alcohol dehydrogenase family)
MHPPKTEEELRMKKVIVITGASSGFGALSARALARAGHTVYASMRETTGRNAEQVAEVEKYASTRGVDLRAIELDVGSQGSCDLAIQRIVTKHSRLDVVIHNAGHMVFGPAEAFMPEQLAELYDINVVSTQRVNRAALPQLRSQHQGLMVWVSSSSAAGGNTPYLAPYFAAKAAMDALAVAYARELTRWGIETSIVVPGVFTGGTNHFAHSGAPADKARAAEYEAGPYAGFPGEKVWPLLFRQTPMRLPWPTRSSKLWTRPLASDRSAQPSTRQRTAPRWSTRCPIACAPKCCVGLVLRMC